MWGQKSQKMFLVRRNDISITSSSLNSLQLIVGAVLTSSEVNYDSYCCVFTHLVL